MSVLVKGMAMPACCIDCPIHDFEFGSCNLIENSRSYDSEGNELYDYFTERHKDCPLEEIKE